MGQLIVLMGPTGTGKSAQGEQLAAHGWHHISSGQLLRADSDWAPRLASGELAPSPAVEELVDTALRNVPVSVPVVLDGFPRTLDEVTWLNGQLERWQRTLDHVIVITTSEAVLTTRLTSRGRGDDTAAAISEKLAEYHEQTQPVIDHYRKIGVLAEVDGEDSIENVFKRITELLG